MIPFLGQRLLGRISSTGASRARSKKPGFRPVLTEFEPRLVPSLAPLTPPEIASAYGFNQIKLPAGYAANGQGQTIAIIEIGYTPPAAINASLSAFDAGDAGQGLAFSLPAPPQVQEVDLSGGADAGAEAETLLDVEWAHAMAPSANIIIFEASPGASDAQSLANFMTAVQDATQYNGPLGQVSVVSMSYGFPENVVPANLRATYDAMFTTPANHVGITFLASSGDDGAGNQVRYGGIEPPNYPAISPNVVGVGGTTLIFPSGTSSFAYPGVATSADGIGESAWGNGNLSYDRNSTPGGGTGGGISSVEVEPSYQINAGLQYSNGSFNARTTPDVSLNADALNSPVLVYDSFDTNQFGQPLGWTAIGGTSFSAPAWAGLIAIADEARAANSAGSLDGATQTLPMLYKLSTNDFHDITQGSDGYSASPGYDLATGLGTPIASRVVGDLWGQNPPIANADTYSVNENSNLVVTAANGVLSNDTDSLNEPLNVLTNTQPTNGKITIAVDGSFTYQPNAGFVGADSFTYSILDTGTGVASTATVHLTVLQGLPDLAPHTPAGWSGSLVVATQSGNFTTPSAISTANTVYLDWAFINQGGMTISTPFQTALLLNGKQIQTWPATVPLSAGGIVQITNYNLGQLAAGTYTVTVTTDYLNQVTESNKNNNSETYSFTVIPPPLPDLAPITPSNWSGPVVVSTEAGSISSATSIKIADTVYVDWAFANQSITPITTGFGVAFLLDGSQIHTWSYSGLSAQGVVSVTDINLGQLAAGTHTLSVVADYQNNVSEGNKNNNTATYTFTVDQPALPDLAPYTPTGWSGALVVSTLSGNTTTSTAIATSNTVYVDWAFINRGGADINTSYDTELLLDGKQVQTWTTDFPVYQSYYTFITDFNLGQLSAGTHTVTVIANWLEQATESSFDNNTETYTFTVTPPGLPDLAPFTPTGWSGPLVLSTQYNNPTTAATITSASTVYVDWAFINQGSSSVTVAYQTELLLDGTQIKTWSATSSLDPNFYSYIANFSLGQLSVGEHTVTVIADYSNQVSESDKTNNTETYAFTVTTPPLADLAPNTPSGWSGPLVLSTQAGNTSTATTITSTDTAYADWSFINQGNATVFRSFRTELLLDGNVINNWVTNPPLAPTIYYYVQDYSLGQLTVGTHTLTVVTDSLDQISESDKTNDTETYTFTVLAVPDITTQPANQTVVPGAMATFLANASGTPSPSVQWQISTDGGTTFSNIGGATSTTYAFPAAANQSGDQFRAVFTNSAGSATTVAATLVVNTVTTGQIGGVVFRDTNLNGIQDNSETGLAGEVVFLDLNNNGILDSGEPNTTTAADGSYSFKSLAPGAYTIRQQSLGGLLFSNPANGTYQVIVTAGANISGQNFANVFTSITVPLSLPPSTAFPAQGQSNADYVEAVYRAILYRNADPGGLGWWTGVLNINAQTRLQVVQGIRDSPEHFGQEIDAFYQTLLGRAADPQGRASWVQRLENGVREEQIAFDFLNSPEYLSKGDKFFVDAMYQSLLGRAFDPTGEASWLNALGDDSSGNPTHAATLTHAQVITDLLYSAESLDRLVEGYYEVFLQRQADPGGLKAWVSELQQGLPFLTIGQDFIASDEFFNKAAGNH